MQPYRAPATEPDPSLTFGSEKKRWLHIFAAFGLILATLAAGAGVIAWFTGHFAGGIRVNLYLFFLPVIAVRLLRRARGGTMTIRRDTRELVVVTKRALGATAANIPLSDVGAITVMSAPSKNGDPECLMQVLRKSGAPSVPLVQTKTMAEMIPWEREVNMFLIENRVIEPPAAERVRVIDPNADAREELLDPHEEIFDRGDNAFR